MQESIRGKCWNDLNKYFPQINSFVNIQKKTFPQIIWIYDHHENNKKIVYNYRKIINFDLERKEELQKISKTHYDLVISDMNREDNEQGQ